MVFRSVQFHNWLKRAAQLIIELRTSENYKLRYLTLISYFEATLVFGLNCPKMTQIVFRTLDNILGNPLALPPLAILAAKFTPLPPEGCKGGRSSYSPKVKIFIYKYIYGIL